MQRNQISIPAAFEKAHGLHRDGQLASAEALYRQILAAMPNHAGALHLLGVIDHHAGKHESAIDLIRKAIGISPSNAAYYNNLATVLRAEGRLEEAVGTYQKALSLAPDYAEAHNNLGNVLNELGQVEGAVASYRRALALKDVPEFKTNFARCLQNVGFARADAKTRQLVARALSEAWARPADLAKASISLLRADPVLGPCIDRASLAWPRRLAGEALYGPAGVSAVAGDPLLRALLENAQISDPAMERFLTMARQAMLDAAHACAAGEAADAAALGFYSALARQCFINDYVFSPSGEETGSAMLLREKLVASLGRGEPIPALWLPAVAAYCPLHCIAGIDAAMGRLWPEALAALLRQQVAEPLEERGYRNAIPRATTIKDEVSLAVQQQYEQSPYPRWVKLPLRGAALPIDAYIRQHFPFAPLRRFNARGDIDVLIAGCGTGQESNEIAHQVDQAQVLAIDLSLSSLGYAKRKAHAAGLRNIHYAQADILQMASLGRSFDVIAASGVLHHLADPMAGLRVLVSLLRPDGLMRLGLYSETGRQAVVAARKFIAERGYLPEAADIRRCRQDLMAAGGGLQFKALTTSRDFFVMGECRDMLFHVQEHRFTLPQIKAMLRTLGLEFLGFSLKLQLSAQFARRYEGDRTQTNLDNWHEFETQFPNTFAGMYQFLVQKSAA